MRGERLRGGMSFRSAEAGFFFSLRKKEIEK